MAALLTAIDPQAKLDLPTFSAEEVVFLSFRTNPDTLPHLPHATDSSARFIPRTRIAVERLWRDHPQRLGNLLSVCVAIHIANYSNMTDIEQTRYLLAAPHDFPELRDYAYAVEKIVACRDLFREAFQQLADHVARRQPSPATRDPVDKILALVRTLVHPDSPARLALFTDPMSGGRPCLKPHESLSRESIGAGPSRRFSDQLSGIVSFEREATKALLPAGWPTTL